MSIWKTVGEAVAPQVDTVYKDIDKLKKLVDVGFFLENYVVSGGEVTKDLYRNDTINVSTIVVSLDNDVTSREGISEKTKIANATYYLDYQSGDFKWGTSHPSGSYQPIAEVTTDGNKNVLVITDKRGQVGGFWLRPGYDFPEIAEIQSHDAISPDAYTGTDAQRVQKAIDDATELNRAVKLDRMYNVGSAVLLINKPDNVFTRTPLYIVGVNGGGLQKDVSGFMFSALTPDNGDMIFENVYFRSVAGAGVKIFDCDNLIRFRSQNCFYKNVDTILYTSDADKYVQSVRLVGDSVVGGSGFVIDIAGSYDTHAHSMLVETRDSFFNHRNVGLHKSLTRSSVKDCVIEGLTGKTMIIGNTRSFDVSGNYFEFNNSTIEFLTDAAIIGFTVKNNIYLGASTTSALIKWSGDIFGAISENNITGGLPTHDTTLVASGHIFSTNDRFSNALGSNIDPADRLLDASADKIITYTLPILGYETSLGLFKRKTSIVINSTVPANSYAFVDVPFPSKIYQDDFVVPYAFPTNVNDQFIICGYVIGTNKVTVRVKNEMGSTLTISALIVNVLHPYQSVTG